MRKILLATVAAVAMTGSAFASDLPSRKSAPAYVPVPAFTWTGFYVGIEGGVDFLSGSAYTRAGKINGDTTGGLVGGVVGYNYDLGNKFVLGLEGNAGGVFADKTIQNVKVESDYYANIRGRVGYAVVDRALLYVAGGVAFGDVKIAGVSDDRVGYTVGAGLDYAFTNNWIGRVEYRYTDLGKSKGPYAVPVSVESNAVLVGLIYKFGAPEAPVVAKY